MYVMVHLHMLRMGQRILGGLRMSECSSNISAYLAGSANGQMQQVATLAPAQHQTFEQPTILLVQQIGGEEDIPQVQQKICLGAW